MWLNAGSGADDLGKRLGALDESLSSYIGYAELSAQKTADLTEKFGQFAGQVRGFSTYLASVTLGQTFDDLRASIDPLKAGLKDVEAAARGVAEARAAISAIPEDDPWALLNAQDALALFEGELDEAAKRMGLLPEQALALAAAMDEVGKAANSPEDIAIRAGEALAVIQQIARDGLQLPAPLREAAAALEEMQRRGAEANVEFERMPTILGSAIDAANAVAGSVGGIGDAALRAAGNLSVMATRIWEAARARVASATWVDNDTGGLASQYRLYGQGRVEGDRLARESGDLYGNRPILPVVAPASGRGGAGGGGGGGAGLGAVSTIKDELARLKPSYAADVAAAEAWRDKALASLKKAQAGYATFAADVETIFQERMAKAYEADLKRRDDWQSGVQRALIEINKDQLSWADVSENIVTKWSSGMEDAFVAMGRTGKFEVGSLVDYVQEQFARLAFQQVIQPGLNSIFGAITGALGIGGPSAAGAAAASISTNHTGSPGVQRTYALGRAGGDRMRPDERLTMMRRGEEIMTARALENAGALISAMTAVAASAASGQPAGSTIVIQPMNNSSVPLQMEVEERTDERGRQHYVMAVSDAVATGLRAPGGKARRTLKADFGIDRQGSVLR
ncbi:hypothetical protein GEU84_011620 [Fertoebacter nigrum]|uniref:Bacteriophage tail tape measure C-terminal domain-containing protein n=2 Tax=Fertoeibacter niger TaxID=2656921 RepID=A0A8X8H3S0_9RHOB|nr:hypothetical protein [Fertoeibacter niger]